MIDEKYGADVVLKLRDMGVGEVYVDGCVIPYVSRLSIEHKAGDLLELQVSIVCASIRTEALPEGVGVYRYRRVLETE